MLKYTDVFVPGGFPRHTYNPRGALDLEKRLGEVRSNLCKLVTVTGQTKSGKTVLTSRLLSREDCVWIDGGTISEEADFWAVINETLDLFQTTEAERTKALTAGFEGTGTVEAGIIVARGSAEAKSGLEETQETGTRVSRTITPRVSALAGLERSRRPLVIDDFHYLPRQLQGDVIRALKPLIFRSLPVVIIAIPHRRYDAPKVEAEMTGRVAQIPIPPWSPEELIFIPTTGFGLLNYKIDREILDRLANEAIGSPHLLRPV